MAVLQLDDITDIVNSTQKDLGPGKLVDLTTDLQYHTALAHLMKKHRVRFGSGRGIQWNILHNGDTNARNVGLMSVDNVNQEDGTGTATVPWRHSSTSTAVDEVQMLANNSPAKILDFVKVKRYQMWNGITELMEQNFWEEPESSTDDTTPFGLKYWMVYNANEGFNGGNNSNFSSGPAGVNRDTYARWKNYTFNYTNVSKVDLVRKWRRAATMCAFRPSIANPPIGGYATGDRYGYYTNYDVIATLEECLEAQNDNLGNDVASKDGLLLFRRIPVEYVPYLQANEATADPVVGIDWGVFKLGVLRGRFLKQKPWGVAPNQHTVRQSFMDATYNYFCYDPRRCFLGAKSTWH